MVDVADASGLVLIGTAVLRLQATLPLTAVAAMTIALPRSSAATVLLVTNATELLRASTTAALRPLLRRTALRSTARPTTLTTRRTRPPLCQATLLRLPRRTIVLPTLHRCLSLPRSVCETLTARSATLLRPEPPALLSWPRLTMLRAAVCLPLCLELDMVPWTRTGALRRWTR